VRALIVESGQTRGALAAARALGRDGWIVGVGTPDGRGLAAASRWTSHRHLVPSPERDLSGFIAAVGTAARERGYEVVFGAGDAEVLALSLRRGELTAAVPYAEHERVVAALDKLELARAADAAGLRVPRTAEASAGELERWTPPLLVKARLHAPVLGATGPARLEPGIAADREDAEGRIARIREAGGAPVLQELVHGRLLACSAVADGEREIVAAVAQIAERTWPPDVGISARARTAVLEPELADGVRRLLVELGWFGLAQLQFILPDGGEPQLIDLNPRFYGSLELAVASGPNLPAIWARLATARESPPAAPPAVGLRYQWLEGDLRRAMRERRGGLLRDLAETFAYASGAVHSVSSLDDVRPAIRYAAMATGRARHWRREIEQGASQPSALHSDRPPGTPGNQQ
jgi:predicted ATP-grasp superfamily ATP-dependent carboligase